jgi:UDP-N-acetyl-D-mannosaminuronic acid dehydrogenase
MSQKTVVVVGAGYVGLPVACAFAGAGLQTFALDVVPERVETINQGKSPIQGDEPGLEELLSKSVKAGRLIATTDYSSIQKADFVVVCVDTPIDHDTKKPRMDILKGAVQSIGQNIKPGALISIESTLPPLTMRNLVIPTIEEESGLKAGKDFFVAHCPERVMPGRLLSNLANYDRVLGGLDERSIELGIELYSNIVHAKLHPTDLLSAEMAKTLENAYRDVQIAFANEVALACEELGADAFEVRNLVNTCPFRDMHIPGAGVGGHCLPKDSWLFASSLKKVKPRIMTTAREVNEYMPVRMVELVKEGLEEAGVELNSAKVAIMGLAFLRDSDDVRNSPSLTIIDQLNGKVKELIVHDLMVQKAYKVPMVQEIEAALTNADCMVIVTDHSGYFDMDLQSVKKVMRTPLIVDGRNVLNAEAVRSKGFRYLGIGKGK